MSIEKTNLQNATPDELAQLAAECLAGLEPGRQPLALFSEMARLMVASIVEVMPIRTSPSGKTEVLLAERPSADPWWANKRSLPGSVQTPSGSMDFSINRDFKEPVDNVLFDDFGDSVVRTSNNIQISDIHQRSGPRGSEQVVLTLVGVDTAVPFTKPIGGDFFDAVAVASYPEDFQLVEGHAEEIRHALADLKRY